MKIKNYIINLVRLLISRLHSDSKNNMIIIFIIILLSLIHGSSILTDILLEQLLQADGVTRLLPPKEVI